MTDKPFSKDKADVVKSLESDADKGLSTSEAQRRLLEYGLNTLGEKKPTPLWKRFLEQFADAMVLILIAAAVLSAVMAIQSGESSEWVDVGVILAIVLINAVLGVYQEGKADQAIAALKRMSSPQSKVLRDGRQVLIPSDQIVPGDIAILDAGDLVAADIRLLSQSSLKVEEASLTGESVPVEKNADVVLAEDCGLGDRENMLFMGTAVTYGRARGIVVGTAGGTELGKIAAKLQNIEESQTPLQKNLTSLGKILGIICIVVCILVFVVDVFVQREPWSEALMTAVSLAVAAIPEGLAAVVTIVLSIGMTRMATRNAIVRKLLAVETLGSVDVICSDKTGTLTQNEMTVTAVYDGSDIYEVTGIGYSPEGGIIDADKKPAEIVGVLRQVILSGVLCSDAVTMKKEDGRYSCIGDPTEAALVALASKVNMTRDSVNAEFPRIAELPFDSDRKMMTTYHPNIEADRIVSFTKGAPDIILDRCVSVLTPDGVIPLDPERKAQILSTNRSFAQRALRVLAFAYRSHDNANVSVSMATFAHEEGMIFLGLAGMIDPARSEAKDAIATCKEAGIRAVMITGDYKDTAVAIAGDLGLMTAGYESLSGAELDKVSDNDLPDVAERTAVYARVSPDNKVKIVTALQSRHHITSMTGDGVNDAMALKKADIGVAMGITGTDVAKNSADMILTDDNFATIVHAIEEGRIIYSNIRKFVGFLLSCNVGEILIIFIISLIPSTLIPGIGVPLTAIQLLWLNLVTDSFPALALGREKGEPDIMKVPPRKKSEPIINGPMKLMIVIQSVAIFSSVFAAFITGLLVIFKDQPVPLEGARTMAFATLIMAELLRAFGARSERISVFKLGFFSNKAMNFAVLFSTILLLAVIYIPGLNTVFDAVSLPPIAWLPIGICSMIPFAVSELFKIFRSRAK